MKKPEYPCNSCEYTTFCDKTKSSCPDWKDWLKVEWMYLRELFNYTPKRN